MNGRVWKFLVVVLLVLVLILSYRSFVGTDQTEAGTVPYTPNSYRPVQQPAPINLQPDPSLMNGGQDLLDSMRQRHQEMEQQQQQQEIDQLRDCINKPQSVSSFACSR